MHLSAPETGALFGGALSVDLTGDELERLDAVSHIALGFPHDFSDTLTYGDTFELIDDHHQTSYTTRPTS